MPWRASLHNQSLCGDVCQHVHLPGGCPGGHPYTTNHYVGTCASTSVCPADALAGIPTQPIIMWGRVPARPFARRMPCGHPYTTNRYVGTCASTSVCNEFDCKYTLNGCPDGHPYTTNRYVGTCASTSVCNEFDCKYTLNGCPGGHPYTIYPYPRLT
jgi:hypothetical protein